MLRIGAFSGGGGDWRAGRCRPARGRGL